MFVFHASPARIHPEPGRSGPFDALPATPQHAPDFHEPNRQIPASPEQGPHDSSGTSPNRAQLGPRVAGRSTQPASADSAGTPNDVSAAYIGKPNGDLHRDARHAGIVVDALGQRYAPIGSYYYAVRYDPANQTLRAVQLQDPAKPGIPIARDHGNWKQHGDIGLPAGSPNDPRVEAARRSFEASRTECMVHAQELTAQERDALQNIDEIAHEQERAVDRLREMQYRGQDPAAQENILHQIEQLLSHAQQTLRGVRDALDATCSTIRDIDRNLALLPPRST
jgi:hypothetical protein